MATDERDNRSRVLELYSEATQRRAFGVMAKSHITDVKDIPKLFVKTAIAWGYEFDDFNDLLMTLWNSVKAGADKEIDAKDKDFVNMYCIINYASIMDDQITRGDYWIAYNFRKRKCYIVPNLSQIDFDVDEFDDLT